MLAQTTFPTIAGQTIHALLSDVDGTLLDTVALIRHGQHEAAVSHLSRIEGAAIPTFDRYDAALRRSVGGSVAETIAATLVELYGESMLVTVDPHDVAVTVDVVQDRLASQYVRAYDNLNVLLEHIGARGLGLAFATSGTPHHLSRNFSAGLRYPTPSGTPRERLTATLVRMRAEFGILKVLAVTAEDVARTKPSPDVFLAALAQLGVRAEHSAALGDHAADMVAAAAAGVPVRIGIAHGFGDRSELFDAGATHVVTSLEEVTALLA